jgi:hypothetical protein
MIQLDAHQIFRLSKEVYIINLIIGIPVFFLLRWILKKLIKNDRIRRPITWIGTLICTPLAYIGLIFLWISIVSYYPTQDFNKNSWTLDKEKRYEMSSDIINSKILIGKTKKEVIEILGDEGNKFDDNIWNYYLGFVPGLFKIDPDVLDIFFENGKVIKVGQHET